MTKYIITALFLITTNHSIASTAAPAIDTRCYSEDFLVNIMLQNENFVDVASYLETEYSFWAEDAVDYTNGQLKADPTLLKQVGDENLELIEPALTYLQKEFSEGQFLCKPQIANFLETQIDEFFIFHEDLIEKIDLRAKNNK